MRGPRGGRWEGPRGVDSEADKGAEVEPRGVRGETEGIPIAALTPREMILFLRELDAKGSQTMPSQT